MSDAPVESGTQEPGVSTDPPANPDGTDPTPPWGSAEEFNPERAWDLIQNLRGDNADLKTKFTESSTKLKEFEDAQLSESERVNRDLDEARQTNGTLTVENARLKAILEHDSLTIEDFDLIGGSTPDEVKDAAAKLAARLGTGSPTPPPSARPREALRGGGDPTVPPDANNDWLRGALSQST